MRLVWPLIVVAAGLAVPFLGSREFVKGFMRYKQKHPGDQSGVSGADIARAEPRMWLLPIGALIVGPILNDYRLGVVPLGSDLVPVQEGRLGTELGSSNA